MVLSESTIKKIQQAVGRFKLYLRYLNVGPHTLTKSELLELARAGYIGPDAAPSTAIAEAYHVAHFHASDSSKGAPETIRNGALRYLERQAALYSDKAADALGAEIVSTLDSHFLPFADRREGKEIYELLKDPASTGRYLGAALRGKVKNWEHRYNTIIRTEANRAANFGSLDAILHNNPDKKPSEIYVYKTGIHDRSESCCDCKRFWFLLDGTPRVYKMSELISNGTNMGKKKAQWMPTVDSTHPNCNHYLLELKPGFGFVNGKLEYVSDSHDEFKAQRGR